MQCPACGRLAAETSAFCGSCGARLSGASLGSTVALSPNTVLSTASDSLVVGFPGGGETVLPLTADGIRIGPGAEHQVPLTDPDFAQILLTVEVRSGGYYLCDLHSSRALVSAGMHLNEAALGTQEPVYVPGSRGRALSFLIRQIARGPALDVRRTAGNPVSIRFRPDQPSIRLGRDPTNDVVVDFPLVSAFHANLERLEHHVLLHDLRSTNGTFVDGQRVRGLQELRPGSEIQIGPVSFIFQGDAIDQVDEQPRVRIDAIDLVRRAGSRILLDKVSLSILPQEFVALIGGSGAGKSTLMHALSGVAPAQEGTVLYNGRDYYRSSGAYAGVMGYVPQDDILHRDLPVERALQYAARLRLPPDTAERERIHRVESVLAEVQMLPQRSQLISRLSGGQRKRVSIALELLANPSILFLDEPTSGLDPGLDKTVMQLLRTLCDQGRTIVLVTHATENIGFCDLAAFLAAGQLVYYGPAAQAPEFFGVQSFPDVYALLADPAQASKQELLFRGSPLYRQTVLERQANSGAAALENRDSGTEKGRPRARAGHQWRVLTERYAELVARDKVNLALLLAQTPVVALALTVVASHELYTASKINNTQQILLMLSVATIWFGTSNAAREIVKERPVYLRERMVNLRLFPYLLSKVGVLAVLGLLQSVVLFAIVTLKTPHLPQHGIILPAFIEMMVSLTLCAIAGMLGGLLISALVRSTDRAMTIVPIALIPQVIFSGAVFDLDGWSRFLSYLTISHWCLAALGSTVRLNEMASRVAVNGRVIDLHRAGIQMPDVVANWPKEMYASPDRVHLLGYWGALGLFSVLFLVGTYLALRRGDSGTTRSVKEGTDRRTWLLLIGPPAVLCTVALVAANILAR